MLILVIDALPRMRREGWERAECEVCVFGAGDAAMTHRRRASNTHYTSDVFLTFSF